jgi:hypothetical protein
LQLPGPGDSLANIDISCLNITFPKSLPFKEYAGEFFSTIECAFDWKYFNFVVSDVEKFSVLDVF